METKTSGRINKTLVLLVLTVLLILILVLGYFILQSKRSDVNNLISPQIIIKPLSIISKTPNLENAKIAGTKSSIIIVFDSRILTDSLVLETTPKISLIPSVRIDNPTRLILTPSSPWVENIEYLITIKKGLQSFDKGKALLDDYLIKFVVSKQETINALPL